MFRSSALVTLLALSASVLGFVVQLLLARRFGISVDVDAYLFALSVPTFIASLVSSMMSYELVPRLVACETDQTYHKRYITTLVLGVSSLSLILGIVGGVFGILQSQMLPSGSPIRLYEYLPHLILLGWAISAFQINQSCLSAILNAHRRYLVAALLALLPYLGMIFSMILLEGIAGIAALPIGMLMGTILATLCGLYILRQNFFPIQLRHLLWPEMRQLVSSSPYTVVAMTCFSSYAVVDAYWAPQAGQGALATLGYAQRLVIAFGNLAVAGPSAVLVPRFAELIREKDFTGLRSSLLRALLAVGGIAAGVAIAMALFAKELVELLFARGSFGFEEVGIVTQTLRCMLPGMVPMLMSVILLRALFCLDGSAKKAAILGLGWTIAYFIASMITYKHGATGLAIGYSVVWFVHFCILGYVFFKCINKQVLIKKYVK
jgi:putative peptidoglycan lipid II flippase